jgi:glycosyltransferase involved in cell wall biosynthesis
VLVINDGSRDATIDVLIERFDLVPIQPLYEPRVAHKPLRALYRSRSHPNLVVHDKENGAKADALNAGLNAATSSSRP